MERVTAPDEASASRSWSQKRRRDQRLKRLYTGVEGPYSAGQSCQRQPIFSTCRMPEITRRSSTLRAPGWFLGRCGSTAAHCSLDSQNSAPTLASIALQRDGITAPPAPSSV